MATNMRATTYRNHLEEIIRGGKADAVRTLLRAKIAHTIPEDAAGERTIEEATRVVMRLFDLPYERSVSWVLDQVSSVLGSTNDRNIHTFLVMTMDRLETASKYGPFIHDDGSIYHYSP